MSADWPKGTVRTNVSLPVDLVRRMRLAPKFNVSRLVAVVIERRLNAMERGEVMDEQGNPETMLEDLTAKEPAQPAAPVCLTPDCGKPVKWKGLCSSCYGCAKYLIDSGKAKSWNELADLGLAVLEEKPFYAAFRKAKAAVGVTVQPIKE